MASQAAPNPDEQPDDTVEPATLVLQGQSILEGTSTAYLMDQSVTSPQKTSIAFERIQPDAQPQHLYYIVHPPHAHYRTDKPAYYTTAVAAPPALGNMRLAPCKPSLPLLQRQSFDGVLSPGRTASHDPLFADAAAELPVFRARAGRWMAGGGRYTWTDEHGQTVAEETTGREGQGESSLVVRARMGRARRDALVALWVLRVWHDGAESRGAKRAGEFPPSMQMGRRGVTNEECRAGADDAAAECQCGWQDGEADGGAGWAGCGGLTGMRTRRARRHQDAVEIGWTVTMLRRWRKGTGRAQLGMYTKCEASLPCSFCSDALLSHPRLCGWQLGSAPQRRRDPGPALSRLGLTRCPDSSASARAGGVARNRPASQDGSTAEERALRHRNLQTRSIRRPAWR